MKYLIISILFVLSLGYAGYYLYRFDKRTGASDWTQKPVKEEALETAVNESVEPAHIPEYLTKEFWKTMTPERLKEKLKSIENVNEVRSDNKKSMLHLLVEHGRHPEMIGLLIDAGADYTLKETKWGGNALHYAVIRKDKAYEFTKALIRYDKNIDEKDFKFGSTSLTWAAYLRAPVSVIQLLLDNEADANATNFMGNTVLISASVSNEFDSVFFIDPDVIQLLLDHKVDITEKNSEGKTAYDYMKDNAEFTKTEVFKKISAQFQ